jgi:hypothetical protein
LQPGKEAAVLKPFRFPRADTTRLPGIRRRFISSRFVVLVRADRMNEKPIGMKKYEKYENVSKGMNR